MRHPNFLKYLVVVAITIVAWEGFHIVSGLDDHEHCVEHVHNK
jgi:hypothetical protein